MGCVCVCVCVRVCMYVCVYLYGCSCFFAYFLCVTNEFYWFSFSPSPLSFRFAMAANFASPSNGCYNDILQFKALMSVEADTFNLPRYLIDDLKIDDFYIGNNTSTSFWFLILDMLNLEQSCMVSSKIDPDGTFVKQAFRYSLCDTFNLRDVLPISIDALLHHERTGK